MRGRTSLIGDAVSITVIPDAFEIYPGPCRRRAVERFAACILVVTIALGVLWTACAARADDLADSILAINNELLTDTRLTSGLLVAGPPEVAREVAIVDSAMFDAANAASGSPYASIAYRGGPDPGASVETAALTAGYTALLGIFGNSIWAGVPDPTTLVGGSAAIQAAVLHDIHTAYTGALDDLGVGSPAVCRAPAGSLMSLCAGIALGTAAGDADLSANGYTFTNGIIDNAVYAKDGSGAAIALGITNPYTPANANPGTYVPPSTRPAMFPTWGTVTPLGLTGAQVTADEAAVPAPPRVSCSAASSRTCAAYARAVLQTECEGSGTALPSSIKSACAAAGFAPDTTAQATAALFWNDPGTTYQPPGHWLSIEDSLDQSQDLSVLGAARLGALVGDALDDVGIAAWDTKYKYNLWRPITAIRDCAKWNPNFATCDPSWSSLIATPPHPDYLAGHPAFSGAAATVLEGFFGTGDIPVTSTSDAYCNGGTPWRGTATQLIVACTTSTGAFAYSDGANGGATFYGSRMACTSAGGKLTTDGAGQPACSLKGVAYTFSPTESSSGCNDIVNVGGANDSLLICPITEEFPTISDASSGPNGAEFSRVAGGIHTPFAVENALALGNTIGEQILAANSIPEPAAIGFILLPIGVLSIVRRFHPPR